MSGKADLHTHTTFSDGVLTVEELFAKAKNVGINTISITDHDTVGACESALALANKYDLHYITGIELTCFEGSQEIHLLGYGFDHNNSALLTHISNYKEARMRRAEKILAKLRNVGIVIEMEQVFEKAANAPITRPHIAALIVDKGKAYNLKDAFNRYLGDGCPADVKKENFPVQDAIKLVNDAGGISSLAHPSNYIKPSLFYKLIQYGLDGVEVVHPSHNEMQIKHYMDLANQYWLISTGGSDYHGSRDYDETNFGKCFIDNDKVNSIKFRTK